MERSVHGVCGYYPPEGLKIRRCESWGVAGFRVRLESPESLCHRDIEWMLADAKSQLPGRQIVITANTETQPTTPDERCYSRFVNVEVGQCHA